MGDGGGGGRGGLALNHKPNFIGSTHDYTFSVLLFKGIHIETTNLLI